MEVPDIPVNVASFWSLILAMLGSLRLAMNMWSRFWLLYWMTTKEIISSPQSQDLTLHSSTVYWNWEENLCMGELGIKAH